jgi:hypothetical protein
LLHATGDPDLTVGKMPKNSIAEILQLASARYTPALGFMNQHVTKFTQAGALCPGQDTPKESALS